MWLKGARIKVKTHNREKKHLTNNAVQLNAVEGFSVLSFLYNVKEATKYEPDSETFSLDLTLTDY